MIILKEQDTPQVLKFIPRNYGADTIVLRNETTNEVQTISASFELDKYYLTTTTAFDLLQNTFYNLTIKNGAEVVYKDKVFCTNQNIVNYTVNKDEYVANATNNDFIIYE
jgi:hypothetical protein